jgi:hypothetical protein
LHSTISPLRLVVLVHARHRLFFGMLLSWLLLLQLFASSGLGPQLFLAWCGWTCVWASLIILVLAVTNTCRHIDRFTRFAGELFGALIAVS